MSKGQSQLIGVVLLTLVMITMIGITYMWGMPLIEKQKDTVRVSNMERFMKELDESVQNVAKNGGIQKIESPGIPGEVKILDQGINDMIVAEFQTTGTDIATGTDIYLRGNDLMEVPIGAEPGVLKVLSEGMGGDTYGVTISLYYRNLTGSESVYVIDLVGLGRDSIVGENHVITVSEGDEVPVTTENGKNVYITRINVRFE